MQHRTRIPWSASAGGCSLRSESVPGGDRLVVTGELDAAGAMHLAELFGSRSGMGRAVARVDIDLQGVEFLDRAGLAALLRIRRYLATGGAAVFLVHPSRAVRRLFGLMGITDLLAPPPADLVLGPALPPQTCSACGAVPAALWRWCPDCGGSLTSSVLGTPR